MSGGGEDMDFCEYVYNPLMRQYQAMMRLMQMISDSQTQSDCNDIECFSPNDPNSPMNALQNVGGTSFLSTYGPMLLIWAIFAVTLFMFRPTSMRRQSNKTKPAPSAQTNNSFSHNHRFFDNDDDDNSFAS